MLIGKHLDEMCPKTENIPTRRNPRRKGRPATCDKDLTIQDEDASPKEPKKAATTKKPSSAESRLRKPKPSAGKQRKEQSSKRPLKTQATGVPELDGGVTQGQTTNAGIVDLQKVPAAKKLRRKATPANRKDTPAQIDNGMKDEDNQGPDQLPEDVDPENQIRAAIIRYNDKDRHRVQWDDIAGLEGAKKILKEAVVLPLLRPDIFSGLREPGRGVLLFGPPGTGKSMLAQAVATEAEATFFSLSSSTLTSNKYGGNEKLVKDLFTLAKISAPSIIFIDEVDSLLSQRGANKTEHEASRRTKNDFFKFWSELKPAVANREGKSSRVFVLGATNLPWQIDEAARRRFERRLYIPLPESHVRERQLRNLLSCDNHEMTNADFETLSRKTKGN